MIDANSLFFVFTAYTNGTGIITNADSRFNYRQRFYRITPRIKMYTVI